MALPDRINSCSSPASSSSSSPPLVVEGSPISSKRVKKVPWTPDEDEALVSAYMKTSIDLKNGTSQMEKNFWRTVLKRFEEARVTKSRKLNQRTCNMCKSRWRRIQRGVSDWLGCYEEAVRKNEGKNGEEDMIIEAHLIYNKSFQYDHCWRNMRKFADWEAHLKNGVQSTFQKSQGKGKRKRDEGLRGRNVDGQNAPVNIESSGKRSLAQVDLDEEIEANPESLQSKRPMSNKTANNYGKVKNLPSGSLDNPPNFVDALSTRSDRELEIQRMKVEVQRMKCDRQDRKLKFNMVMQLNSKPQLDHNEQQMRMMLMQDLGFIFN